MQITLLAFASARDDFGFSSRSVSCDPQDTPRDIVLRLAPGATLDHLRVALDREFADWDAPVGSVRELALIPPVSGG